MNELEKLINENENLIHQILKRYKGIVNYSAFEYDDLFQEAVEGFIKAYKTYDESKGEFSTYATTVIRNKLTNFIKYCNNQLKFPYVYTLVWKAMKEHGTNDANELSEILNVPLKKVIEALIWYENKDVKQFGNMVDVENALKTEDDTSVVYVNEFVNKFDGTNKQIIEMRLDDKTQTEISIELKISQCKVSITLGKIKNKLSIYIKQSE